MGTTTANRAYEDPPHESPLYGNKLPSDLATLNCPASLGGRYSRGTRASFDSAAKGSVARASKL